jgi:hypothetical protein
LTLGGGDDGGFENFETFDGLPEVRYQSFERAARNINARFNDVIHLFWGNASYYDIPLFGGNLSRERMKFQKLLECWLGLGPSRSKVSSFLGSQLPVRRHCAEALINEGRKERA